MKTEHLSAWEQEEYVLEQGTPDMLRHLSECAECRAAVERLEQGVGYFRSAAIEWSAECLAERPRQPQFQFLPRKTVHAMRWVFAAALPLLLLALVLIPVLVRSHVSPPPQPVAQISDDALIDQVDEQVSESVPSSMESLTHLVSTGNNSGSETRATGSKPLVQTN
jgi:anti-sigma factor RsiW